MSFYRKSAVLLASAYVLATLSGCNRIEKDTTAALTQFPISSGGVLSSLTSSDFLTESSLVSSDSTSSEGVSSVAPPPAPAPEQPITQNVTKDPIFQQTEETIQEDPQKGDSSAGREEEMGSGGTITIPETPSTGGSSSGSSSTTTSSVSSSTPSSSSEPGSSSSSAGSSSSSSSSSDSDSSSGSSSGSEGGSSSGSSSAETSPQAPAPTWPTDPNYSGWWDTAGKRYCYLNGKKLIGWQNINNVGYYFDSEGALSSKCGIDVSQWNGDIDWKKVKADGIDFVFIRAGYRGYGTGVIVMDRNFVENIEGATAAGLEVGIYFFSQAINAAEGQAEAQWCLSAAEEYPNVTYLAIDTEKATSNGDVGRADNISRKDRTDAMEAFCKTVEQAGKKSMIYASQSWFENQLDLSRLTSYGKWVARWATTISWSQPFQVWQSCSDGKVDGISGDVDRNAWKIES